MSNQMSGTLTELIKPAAVSQSLELMSLVANLLFENGQTTRRMVEAVTQMGDTLGVRATLIPHWGELTLRVDDDKSACYESFAAEPAGVDMHRVAGVMQIVDDFNAGKIDIDTALSALEAIRRFPPASTLRFALMAAAGAVALGVIFGAAHLPSLVLIALSAGVGACLRRGLAKISHSPFVQPLCAATLAGIIGAIAMHFDLGSVLRLVAVCPCMVLVPGPHLLNGAIDLARLRIGLGAARIAYAGLILLMICTGLLLGLALGGEILPVEAPSIPVPVGYDVIAAGVAVAAYGTFFSMPWRTLPIPILIGMLAHAVRWMLISMAGASVEVGALVACLIVSILITPIGDRLRMPFAAFAFASVVSLIPGVFLFRMASGFVSLITLGGKAPPDLLADAVTDGMTALLIMLAMAFGLIVPKMIIGRFLQSLSSISPRERNA
jgi:uncharacterized membrane protein YjjP (DUF1212 family)